MLGLVAILTLGGCAWALVAMLVCERRRVRRVADQARERRAHALHELRRPLGALVLCRTPAEVERQIDAVLEAIEDLEWAVAGLPGAYMLRPVEVRPLVESVVSRWSLGSQAGGHQGIQIRWAAGPARALADPRRLVQALENLVANAIEHGGAPIAVEATTCAAGLRLKVRNRVDDAGAPGMDGAWSSPADRGHGLSIVSEIVRAHGGRFLFDCSGAWAVGTIELPLAGATPETAFAR